MLTQYFYLCWILIIPSSFVCFFWLRLLQHQQLQLNFWYEEPSFWTWHFVLYVFVMIELWPVELWLRKSITVQPWPWQPGAAKKKLKTFLNQCFWCKTAWCVGVLERVIAVVVLPCNVWRQHVSACKDGPVSYDSHHPFYAFALFAVTCCLRSVILPFVRS